MILFPNVVTAVYRSRPNRFIVQCLVNDKLVRAYLPNPGRLHELFLPGAKLFLVQRELSQGRTIPYMVVAVERDGVEALIEWASLRRGSSEVLFCTREGTRLDQHNVRRTLRRAGQCGGIKQPVRPHAFRHSHAVSAQRGGVSLGAIQQQLGHANPGTTWVYLAHLGAGGHLDEYADR
jgi:site-specific recombinase XerC